MALTSSRTLSLSLSLSNFWGIAWVAWVCSGRLGQYLEFLEPMPSSEAPARSCVCTCVRDLQRQAAALPETAAPRSAEVHRAGRAGLSSVPRAAARPGPASRAASLLPRCPSEPTLTQLLPPRHGGRHFIRRPRTWGSAASQQRLSTVDFLVVRIDVTSQRTVELRNFLSGW